MPYSGIWTRMTTSHDSQRRSVFRTRALGKPALGRAGEDGSLGGVPVPRRPSPEVTSLIERLRKLVAERRRLEQRRDASRELLERRRREIERLQQRLANLVKRELPT
jgi:hypothetical protein